MPLVVEKPLVNHMQRLSHSEVDAPVYRALWLFLPEPPAPPTVCALAPFVDVVLAQQHGHTREQPHHLVFEYRLRGRLITTELVRQGLNLIQK
jgi:hypothetical protein